MKKQIILLFICCLSVLGSNAQESSSRSVKLGIKIAPTISYARVTDKKSDDNINYSRSGSVARLIIGPYVDFAINENVTFSTGLWYSPRAVALAAKYKDTLGNTTTFKSQYNLQYVMIPVYFKFYTNEITSGMKLYFTLGATVDIKIAEKKDGDDNIKLKEYAEKESHALFTFMDATILAGTGVEYNLKDITTLYGGISYNRGLVNIINPFFGYDVNGNKVKPYQNLSIKNNLLSLDLGVKF
jgi:Outer membrane protein beta-barrel domain